MSARAPRVVAAIIAATLGGPTLALAQEAETESRECTDGLYSADELRAHLALELTTHPIHRSSAGGGVADVRLDVRAEDCTLEEGRVDVDVEIASRDFRRSASMVVSGPDVRARSRMLAIFTAELVRSGLAESTPRAVDEPTAAEPPAPSLPDERVSPPRAWSLGIAVAGTALSGYGAAALGGRAFADWSPIPDVPLVFGVDVGGAVGVALDVLGPVEAAYGELALSVGAGVVHGAIVSAWGSFGWATLSGQTMAGLPRAFDGPLAGVGVRGAMRVALAPPIALVLEARLGWYVVGLEVTREGRTVGGIGGPSIGVAVGVSVEP